MNKNFKQFIILMYKLCVYFLLCISFFGIFSIRNIGLVHLSRTVVITVMTFIVFGTVMLNIYGNFAIGKEKSKPIIYSTAIAVLMTDIVTYVQLMIMNTNPKFERYFRLKDLDLLLYVFIIQIIIIFIASYLGNHIYFKLFKPQKTLLIYDENLNHKNKILYLMSRYQLQYDVLDAVSVYDKRLKEFMSYSDYIVFLDMAANKRDYYIRYCYDNQKDFAFVPDISDVILFSSTISSFDDIPILESYVDELSIEQKIMKRFVDIVISLIALVITSPILFLAAIAIKLEDGGAIFFKQKRYTQDHKIFEVIKFRSMRENVENYSATQNDDRITKVGHILRKTRLDELPQFINVLKGEMSVVGPRPEMLENVHDYEKDLPEFAYRLKVKAGLTGLAQIEGKYNTSPKDKLLMDLIYIENYSLWTDFKLIFKTFIVFFKKDSTEGFNDEKN